MLYTCFVFAGTFRVWVLHVRFGVKHIIMIINPPINMINQEATQNSSYLLITLSRIQNIIIMIMVVVPRGKVANLTLWYQTYVYYIMKNKWKDNNWKG